MLPLILSLLFALDMPNEMLYLDIDSDIANMLPGKNPAFLSIDNIPYNFAFRYHFRHDGGSDKLPFTPDAKAYHNISAVAYKEMDNGLLFGGRFAYRDETRKNKLFLHNAENYLDIPFYFGDSTAGDFRLNGIDWNMLLAYPLSSKLRFGMDVFYNVDEQMKTAFPKPNVKRNDVHVRPGISYRSGNFAAGFCASYFNYKEQMYTRKYVLEQGRTPIFMRIRGLDRPVLSYAQTSEERLQSIGGIGVSGNINMSGILLLEAMIEQSSADIVEGGADPVPQGNWDQLRYAWRAEIRKKSGMLAGSGLYVEHNTRQSEGFHPTLNQQIFNGFYRHIEGGLQLHYQANPVESLYAGMSYLMDDYKREDNFFGLLHYVPLRKIKAEVRYAQKGQMIDFDFGLSYTEDLPFGDPVVYADKTGEYYTVISAEELKWWLRDRRCISADMQLVLPFYGKKLALRGTYTLLMPINSDQRFHYAETGIAYLF